MFFSKKKRDEEIIRKAVNGVISVFGDNLRAAGLNSSFLPLMKNDKVIIGSLYGFCLRAAEIYDKGSEGMQIFMISYSQIFDVIDHKEMAKVTEYALFDDEVNNAAEKTFNYLLDVADSGLSQQEAMLFMKDNMVKYF